MNDCLSSLGPSTALRASSTSASQAAMARAARFVCLYWFNNVTSAPLSAAETRATCSL